MKRILSFFLIGLFLASTIGAGVCMAKANHYDYKVVGEDGVSYEITGKFGNYNENQDHTSNRVTVYNADVYDSEGNYVGKADVVNWNKNSNNGAHCKWHVEESTPVVDDNNTSEEVNSTEEVTPEPVANVTEDVNTTEPVANVTEPVTDDNNTTEEVVNNTTEIVNDTVANTTEDNDVIGSGSLELDENGTIVNGTAVIPDDGHMCDNVSLSNASSKVAGNNATSKVANKTVDNSTNSTVANDNDGRSIDLANFKTGSEVDLLIIAIIVCLVAGIYEWNKRR